MAEFEPLLAAMRAELAALDEGDPAAISAATAAKLKALAAVRAGTPVTAIPRAALEAARSLNALASARVNMLMQGVERRLEALTIANGAAPSLCYGPKRYTAAR